MINKVILLFIFFILILVSLILLQKNRSQAQSTLVSAEGKLITGTPEFPVWPDAEIEKSNRKVDQDKEGYEVVYEIEGMNPAEAMTWYRSELLKQGWEVYDESIDDVVTDLYIYARRDKELVNIFGESEEGKTEITIEYPVQ